MNIRFYPIKKSRRNISFHTTYHEGNDLMRFDLHLYFFGIALVTKYFECSNCGFSSPGKQKCSFCGGSKK